MTAPPSPWVVRWAPFVPAGRPVLDVACGAGRHTRLFLERGHAVVAVDRDLSRLGELAGRPRLETVEQDLEGDAWPVTGRRFAGVIVTKYLHRPLLPALVAAVTVGGVLVYETFAVGQERFGRPSNPDFLLRPGELLEAVRGQLQVVAYEDVTLEWPAPARVQRICARREPG